MSREEISASSARPSETEFGKATIDDIVIQLAGRIDALIAEEAAILQRADENAIESILARKEHLALEAGRLTLLGKNYSPDPQVSARLQQTLGRLGQHAELIRQHIEALKHLCGMISELYCEVSSDGTYDNLAYLRQARR